MQNRLANLLELPADNAIDEALRMAKELGIHTVGAEVGSRLVLDEDSGALVFQATAVDMLTE